MFPWPTPELTENERRYVSYYKHVDSKTGRVCPGVLKRIYQVELTSQAVPASGYPTAVFTDNVLISRRARVFALTFHGDLSAWLLNIQTGSGERFTVRQCLVSAMTPGSLYDGLANVGEPVNPLEYSMGMGALLIDPNWELIPNEPLVFEGELISTLDPAEDQRFLTIGVHVWEFPGMGFATTEERELT